MITYKNYLGSGYDLLTSDNVNVEKLDPLLASMMIGFVIECHLNNIKVLITQGYRTIEYQDTLYSLGRTTKGKIVTNCKGGQSPHNYGLAFDFAPLEINGTINWNTILNWKWRKCGQLGKKVGLEWGGGWLRFIDMPHLELPDSSKYALEQYNKKFKK